MPVIYQSYCIEEDKYIFLFFNMYLYLYLSIYQRGNERIEKCPAVYMYYTSILVVYSTSVLVVLLHFKTVKQLQHQSEASECSKQNEPHYNNITAFDAGLCCRQLILHTTQGFIMCTYYLCKPFSPYHYPRAS